MPRCNELADKLRREGVKRAVRRVRGCSQGEQSGNGGMEDEGSRGTEMCKPWTVTTGVEVPPQSAKSRRKRAAPMELPDPEMDQKAGDSTA